MLCACELCTKCNIQYAKGAIAFWHNTNKLDAAFLNLSAKLPVECDEFPENKSDVFKTVDLSGRIMLGICSRKSVSIFLAYYMLYRIEFTIYTTCNPMISCIELPAT